MGDLPIGTRVRMVGDVMRGLKNKMCTIAPPEDILISHPGSIADGRLNVCRMDEIGEGHLYWSASRGTLEIVEGPEHPIRCLINRRELAAHTKIIRQLIDALKKGDYNDREELLRCADAAADKIAEMAESQTQRGVALETEPKLEIEE